MLAKLHLDFPPSVSATISPNASPLHIVEVINYKSHKRVMMHKGVRAEVMPKSLNGAGKKLHSRCSTKCLTSYGGRLPDILKALDRVEDLDEALKPWEATLKQKEMCIILKEQVCWERAFEIFEWFKRKGSYELTVFHYTIVLRVLGKAGEWSHVQRLWDEMNEDANDFTYNTLIDIHGKAGRIREAYEIFSLMLRRGIAPDVVTYNTLIHMIGKGGQLEEASEIFALMLRDGIAPDRVTFSTLIDMHGKAGHVREASEMFALMRREGIAPTEVTFNTLIDIYAKAGQLKEASEIFVLMRKEGIAPTTVTISTLIDMHGKAGRLREAWEMFALMVREGIALDTVTFSTMIHIFGNHGHLLEVASLVEKMEELRCPLDTRTYNILISVHAKYDYLDEATYYFTKMKKACLEPDLISYATLFHAYSVRGMDNEAEDLMLEIDKKGLENLIGSFKRTGGANDLTFTMILCAYKRMRRFEEAIQIANQMREQRVLTKLLSYNNVIGLYVRDGRFEDVVGTVKEMMGASIQPDEHTFRSLRFVSVESGVSEQAVGMLEVSAKKDTQRGLQTWLSVLSSVV